MNYAPMATSSCGCNGGGVIMSGVIMNGGAVGSEVIVEPQATGEVIDQTSPPAPVETKPEENKAPAPAETETAGQAADAPAKE